MAVTYHVAMPFIRDEAGDLVAGEPKEYNDAGRAGRMAATLASDPKHCGAIAFSRTGDPSTGEFEDAVVIKSFGEVDPLVLGG